MDDSGSSYRDHLQGLLSRAREPQRVAELQAELALPPFPEALRYLWRAFARIRRRCGGNGFGPSPITWGDIDAYSRLSGLRLSPWEVEVIEALDDALLASIAKRPIDAGIA